MLSRTGRLFVAANDNLGVVVTWNGQSGFTVWDDDTRDQIDYWTVYDLESFEEAQEYAVMRLDSIEQGCSLL
jgi:hypothetical protein